MRIRFTWLRAGGVAAFAAGAVVAPTVAHADVYWTTALTIGRANDDGSGANSKYIQRRAVLPVAVAASGNRIFWANQGPVCGKNEPKRYGSIGSSRLDGSAANPLWLPAADPQGLAARDGLVYWSTYQGKIGRASIGATPTKINRKFITGLGKPTSLAVDTDHVYWLTRDGKIGRANLDGSGVSQTWIQAGANVTGLAVDSGHVYWTKTVAKTTSIVRANLDGSGVDESFITGIEKAPYINGLAVNSTHIYWTASALFKNPTAVMGRASIDGSDVQQEFLTADALVPAKQVGYRSLLPGLAVTE